ncbi:MAG TPA: hypothetical protein PK988_05965, partial [Candidatus Sumerlaeota bacterium]|nr:hypothetical protein [Candidatus Sumerlaeota bacterium]
SCSTGANPDFSRALAATTPKDAIAALRALCPNSVLVAHRPIFPQVGLLTLSGFDTATLSFAQDAPLPFDIDAFQIWEGKRQAIINNSYLSWMQLSLLQDKVTPVAYSMSAGTYGEEIGYPRLYIRSSESDPQKLNLDELSRNIKQGKVQITNGPFIEMKVNGAEPGDIVTAKDKTIQLELKVYTPSWANVSSITISMNGALSRKIMLPAGSVDAESGIVYPSPTNSKPEDSNMKLQVHKDSIMTVIVEGDEALPQDPVNPFFVPLRDPKAMRGQYSFAMAQPVFIDADGDGLVKPELLQTKSTSDTQSAPNF